MMAFEATFGVVAGYGHGNDGDGDAAVVVARAWSAAMEAEMAGSGILVSAVVCAGRAVYPAGFGCPDGGEAVASVRGAVNPRFVGGARQPGVLAWRAAVLRVAAATRAALRQDRVLLCFTDAEAVYLEPGAPSPSWPAA